MINFSIYKYLTYISKFGKENLICNSFLKELTMNYFVPIGIIKDRTTKMYPKYFNGDVTMSFVLFYQFFFIYDPACKAWLFEKFIFELEASNKFKITCNLVRQVILLRQLVMSSARLCTFMLSYLYAFNPSISIKENGKYLNHNNI